jgi:DNA-binding response OmpR family regulator
MQEHDIDILVAEDDEQIAYLLNFMLEREGYKVHIVEDGQQVVDFIANNKPVRLALLDIMMPYVDGIQVLKLIKNNTSWNKVPVVMLTSKSREHDIVKALELGASEYISKPFQPGELTARIKMLLRRAA